MLLLICPSWDPRFWDLATGWLRRQILFPQLNWVRADRVREPGRAHRREGRHITGPSSWDDLSYLPRNEKCYLGIKWKICPRKDSELLGGMADKWQRRIPSVLRVAVSYPFATLVRQSVLGVKLIWGHQQGIRRDHAWIGRTHPIFLN